MGSAWCCSKEPASVSLQVLKDRLENSRRRMRDAPQVWVVIQKFAPQDVLETTITASKFCLEGLQMRASIEISGSYQQIVKEIGAEAALKLMDRVQVAPTRMNSEIAKDVSKLKEKSDSANSLIQMKDRSQDKGPDRIGVGKGGSWENNETKIFDVHVVLNMYRDSSQDAVRVSVSNLQAEIPANDGDIQKVPLQSNDLRRLIEDACRDQAHDILGIQEPPVVTRAVSS